MSHGLFPRFLDHLRPGDLVVANDTRVLPARLLGRKPTGASAEILLLEAAEGALAKGSRDPRLWRAMVRPGGKLKPGRTVEVAPDLVVRILDSLPGGTRLVRLETELTISEALSRHGRIPLPPYMGRDDEPEDRQRYQTVYAAREGSVAAPTAGLHFTEDLIHRIRGLGVDWTTVTLHVGVGTFRVVDAEDPESHEMHKERYHVPERLVAAVNACRSRGARVWAVGTTVVRTLESAVGPDGSLMAGPGETALFIRPPYDFKVVDGLLTNFHLPRSTLLMLVSAFGGTDLVKRAYEEAVSEEYRFYSYGDAMVLLP
ncbi:MAG: tRNA preQ1(34) S-adenosylmethionine ribosyltransferase-isomerase QueA [Gemmatimonadetes bacterium]|nr:tRNA preQ1(34) S-adenosylmethionine ribosyltransferase-isomerase QueA [Gemmatimonadota bacterium]